MIDEQIEFRISQYAEGTLPAAEIAALEATLASDADVRALLEEYRALDVVLKRDLPLPDVKWDRLADHLSRAVAEEDQATTTYVMTRAARWGRIAVAVAAIVLIATSIALWMRPKPLVEIVTNQQPQPTGVVLVEVFGPAAEAATQPIAIEIAIGPDSAQDENFHLAEGIIYRPSRLTIASGEQPVQDNSRLPY